MTSALLWRLAPAVVLLLMLGVACSGDDDGGPSPTVSPSHGTSPGVTASSTPNATFVPSHTLTFAERITLYGAEAGDQASGLATSDFNGDGSMDVALAAAFGDGRDNAAPDAGEVYLFFGPFQAGESRDAAAGDQDATLFGGEAGGQAGRALASGDVTGDGLDDLIVGAPFVDAASRADAGAAYIVPGRAQWADTLDLSAEPIQLLGADERDLAGFSLATGDVTGDGVVDIIASAFWGDGPDEDREDAGEVYVIPGGHMLTGEIDLRSAPPGGLTVYGAAAGTQLGETVAVGTLDRDGMADLVLAATFGDGPDGSPDRVGNVYVLLGGTRGVVDLRDEAPLIVGRDEGDQLGHSLAAGDFDGDGLDDLLLGAVSADGPENSRDLAGEAALVPGSVAAEDTPLLADEGVVAIFYGGGIGYRVGRSLAAGDLDADGREDLLIAAPGSAPPGGDDSGSLLVIFGRESLPRRIDFGSTEADATIEGLDDGDALGTSTAAKPSVLVRDIDGDGRGDILAGSIGAGPANDRPSAGEAYVLLSRPLP